MSAFVPTNLMYVLAALLSRIVADKYRICVSCDAVDWRLNVSGGNAHAESESAKPHLLAMGESDAERCGQSASLLTATSTTKGDEHHRRLSHIDACGVPELMLVFLTEQVNFSNANKSIHMTPQEVGTGESTNSPSTQQVLAKEGTSVPRCHLYFGPPSRLPHPSGPPAPRVSTHQGYPR